MWSDWMWPALVSLLLLAVGGLMIIIGRCGGRGLQAEAADSFTASPPSTPPRSPPRQPGGVNPPARVSTSVSPPTNRREGKAPEEELGDWDTETKGGRGVERRTATALQEEATTRFENQLELDTQSAELKINVERSEVPVRKQQALEQAMSGGNFDLSLVRTTWGRSDVCYALYGEELSVNSLVENIERLVKYYAGVFLTTPGLVVYAAA